MDKNKISHAINQIMIFVEDLKDIEKDDFANPHSREQSKVCRENFEHYIGVIKKELGLK